MATIKYATTTGYLMRKRILINNIVNRSRTSEIRNRHIRCCRKEKQVIERTDDFDEYNTETNPKGTL